MKIALLSAFVGRPGADELKITDGCRRRLDDIGVDLYLFNNTNLNVLEPHVVPDVVPAEAPIHKREYNWLREKMVDIRFRQYKYPTHEANRNRLVAKLPKMQFQKLLAKPYDYYVWFDSKFTLLDEWPDVLLKMIGLYGQHELVLCPHSERNCIKDEFEYMKYYMRKKSDNLCSKYVLKDMYYQVADYLSDPGFIDDALYECGFLLFSDKILLHDDFLNAWYAHNYYYSIQDQLSIPYLLKKFNVDVCPLDTKVYQLEGTKYGYRN